MADVTPILIKDLAAQTTMADTDYMIIGGADAKKITVAQMKEALGINALNSKKPYIRTYTLTPDKRDANIFDMAGKAIHKGYFGDGASVAKLEAITVGTGYPNYASGIITYGFFQEVANLGDADNAVNVYMDNYGYLKIAFPKAQNQNYDVITMLTIV